MPIAEKKLETHYSSELCKLGQKLCQCQTVNTIKAR